MENSSDPEIFVLTPHVYHFSFGNYKLQKFFLSVVFIIWLVFFPNQCIREGVKRKVSAREPIFGGSCVPKPLPLEDGNITGVPQAARKIKE